MENQTVMPESKELIVIEKLNMLTVFTGGGLDTALAEIEQRARSIITDPSTKKGREEIRTLAARLASTRTALYDSATALTEGWRDNTKKVNTERKRMEEKLQALQDEIRKPLTEFENNEKIRVLHHQQALEALKALAVFMTQPTSLEVQQRIDQLPALSGREWEEFSTQSAHDLKLTVDSLNDRLARTLKYEADQKELEILREKQKIQDQKDRDQIIADKAKADAEAKALESEYQAYAAIAALYDSHIEADLREHAAAAKAWDDALEGEIRDTLNAAAAYAFALNSIEREYCLVAQAYDNYLTGVANAAKAERDKIDAEKAAKDAADKKRSEDLEHKQKINGEAGNEIAEVLLAVIAQPGPIQASVMVSAIIESIAADKIPHVKISY